MPILNFLLVFLLTSNDGNGALISTSSILPPPPIFSVSGGILKEPVKLSLSTSSNSLVIYTLDKTIPTRENGITYEDSFLIDKTTIVRAATLSDGQILSSVETRTYIFPEDIIRQSSESLIADGWPSYWGGASIDMGMDPSIVDGNEDQLIEALTSVPSFSIVLPFDSLFDEQRGIFSNSTEKGRGWERPVSIELIYPPDFFNDANRESRHGHPDGFAINGGLRVRGLGSRKITNPKHSLRLYFRGSYGPKNLKYNLFGDEGTGEFDKFDLQTAQSHSWSLHGSTHHTFVRDVFSRDTQKDMGLPYTRSRYYHLYLNGQYWGVYQTQERADHWHGEFYLGGDKDDFDVVKHDNGRTEISEGKEKSWKALYDSSNELAALIDETDRNSLYMRLQGLNPDGTRNSNYPVLLDADNLIQYMLIIFWTANTDGPLLVHHNAVNNFIGMRDRKGDRGFSFFIHDAEYSLFPGPGSEDNPRDRTGPFPIGNEYNKSNPQWIHQQLMGSSHYRHRFAELAEQHFSEGGALSNSSVLKRWDSRVSEVRPIIIAESARWGDFKSDPPKTYEDWQWAVDYVREQFLPLQTPIVIEQLLSAQRYQFGKPSDPLIDAPLYRNTILNVSGTNSSSTVLHQNYPNPFNSTTMISFSLDRTSPLILKLYDSLGRQISILEERILPQSRYYALPFDGSDLPSGVYFISLETDAGITTKRITLIK